MLALKDVKEEITLHYTIALALNGGGSVSLAAADEGVKVAQEIAAKNSCGGITLLTSFQINKSITAKYNGHKLVNEKPIILQPKSYFGQVVPIKNERNRGGSSPGFKRAVKTDSGLWYPLDPGERVYDLKTGKLLHTEPL